MTDSVTNTMKQKARGAPPPPFDPEDIRAMRQGIEDLQDTAASIQILVREATDADDFKPPLVAKLQDMERKISKTSGDLSSTAMRMNAQVKRIEEATDAMFNRQIRYLRNMTSVVCLVCNLPGPIAVFLLARQLGLL